MHKKGILASTFYKEYRGAFMDNLRRKGALTGVKKGGAPLAKDKVLTPNFEYAIIMLALEKIDPRLPRM